MLKKDHLKIYFFKEYAINTDNKLPIKIKTFISFKNASEIFMLYGNIPSYFGKGDIVNITYKPIVVKGYTEYHIFEMEHIYLNKRFTPLLQFPTIKELQNYEQVNWEDKRPYWVIYKNKVFKFSKMNYSIPTSKILLITNEGEIKHNCLFNDCSAFYLDRLNNV